jgi:four helix bundle protein
MEKQLSFESLDCWQDSKQLAVLVYSITDPVDLSNDRDFSRQMRRASVSGMNNISEGYSRYNPKAIVQFMGYALGSCSEVLSMTIIGKELV